MSSHTLLRETYPVRPEEEMFRYDVAGATIGVRDTPLFKLYSKESLAENKKDRDNEDWVVASQNGVFVGDGLGGYPDTNAQLASRVVTESFDEFIGWARAGGYTTSEGVTIPFDDMNDEQIVRVVKEAARYAQRKLVKRKQIDGQPFAFTTLATIIPVGNRVVTFNVGDSPILWAHRSGKTEIVSDDQTIEGVITNCFGVVEKMPYPGALRILKPEDGDIIFAYTDGLSKDRPGRTINPEDIAKVLLEQPTAQAALDAVLQLPEKLFDRGNYRYPPESKHRFVPPVDDRTGGVVRVHR